MNETKVGSIIRIGLLLGLTALSVLSVHHLLKSIAALDTLLDSERLRAWIVQLGWLGSQNILTGMRFASSL